MDFDEYRVQLDYGSEKIWLKFRINLECFLNIMEISACVMCWLKIYMYYWQLIVYNATKLWVMSLFLRMFSNCNTSAMQSRHWRFYYGMAEVCSALYWMSSRFKWQSLLSLIWVYLESYCELPVYVWPFHMYCRW